MNNKKNNNSGDKKFKSWDWLLNNEHLQNISNIIEQFNEQIEGNLICNIEARNWEMLRTGNKIKNLQYICKQKKKIIEIGINGCHSLLLMLLANPTAEYLLFDANFHSYTLPTLNYLKKAFPNTKINIKIGDSVETIKKYIIDNPNELNTYDLIHIDGGHTEDIFSQDYNNSKQLINKKNGIVIFDDYNFEPINKFINKKINKKEIEGYNDSNLINDEPYLHFIYKYI